jgi:hypothetical protein
VLGVEANVVVVVEFVGLVIGVGVVVLDVGEVVVDVVVVGDRAGHPGRRMPVHERDPREFD